MYSNKTLNIEKIWNSKTVFLPTWIVWINQTPVTRNQLHQMSKPNPALLWENRTHRQTRHVLNICRHTHTHIPTWAHYRKQIMSLMHLPYRLRGETISCLLFRSISLKFLNNQYINDRRISCMCTYLPWCKLEIAFFLQSN